jgi:hypothetical protein
VRVCKCGDRTWTNCIRTSNGVMRLRGDVRSVWFTQGGEQRAFAGPLWTAWANVTSRQHEGGSVSRWSSASLKCPA